MWEKGKKLTKRKKKDVGGKKSWWKRKEKCYRKRKTKEHGRNDKEERDIVDYIIKHIKEYNSFNEVGSDNVIQWIRNVRKITGEKLAENIIWKIEWKKLKKKRETHIWMKREKEVQTNEVQESKILNKTRQKWMIKKRSN